MNLKTFFGCIAALLVLIGATVHAVEQPLRILLITGGCCHDYADQKDVLKKGIEARISAVVTQVHTDDTSSHPPLAILGNADYAKGYDLVIHDECGSDISDPATIAKVLKPHLNGIPGVNLHCAMHSYRVGNPNEPAELKTAHGLWFEYLGLQSSAHGAQLPISIHFLKPANEITKGFSDWTTVNEELYNNIKLFPDIHPLARGAQTFPENGSSRTNDFVVVWTNEYGPMKTRVFCTTLGHNTETVNDARYLDLVARGVAWAAGDGRKVKVVK